MGRVANFEPKWDKGKALWYIYLPPWASPTKKTKREYFKEKASAEARSVVLKRMIEEDKEALVKHANPLLLSEALEVQEWVIGMGYTSITEAFRDLLPEYEKKSRSMRFGKLVEVYEQDHEPSWSDRTINTRWRSFTKRVKDLSDKPIARMDSDFWRGWLSEYRRTVNPAPVTYNDTLKQIRSIFEHEKAIAYFPRNPLKSIPVLKVKSGDALVNSPEEVEALFSWVHTNDPQMIPYFALGYFAGLRPTSEIAHMTYEKINFADGLIDVNTTKTAKMPRRQVPLSDNAALWLAPFSRMKGPIYFQRRAFRNARTGAAIALYGKDKEGNPLQDFPWGKDIMRHSYGSYRESQLRGTPGAMEELMNNMGHTTRKTYDRHYHNFRTTGEASKFWAIAPPVDEESKVIHIA